MVTRNLVQNPSNNKPTLNYFHSDAWRNLHPFDAGKADLFRRFMCRLALYPLPHPDPAESAKHSEIKQRGEASQEANSRAILHALADELDTLDAIGLARLAKLLLLEPRTPQVLEDYRQQEAAFLQRLQALVEAA